MSMRVDDTGPALGRKTAGEIRAELARQQMSGSELARRLGMTQPYLSRRLTGEVDFRIGELERIAEVLGVPVAQLFPSAASAA